MHYFSKRRIVCSFFVPPYDSITSIARFRTNKIIGRKSFLTNNILYGGLRGQPSAVVDVSHVEKGACRIVTIVGTFETSFGTNIKGYIGTVRGLFVGTCGQPDTIPFRTTIVRKGFVTTIVAGLLFRGRSRGGACGGDCGGKIRGLQGGVRWWNITSIAGFPTGDIMCGFSFFTDLFNNVQS